MSQASAADPLRFLNIRKKRQANKQRVDLKLSFNKEMPSSETSHFVLPSLSSMNSLDKAQTNTIKKEYNPMKYFNPEIEEYLRKLTIFKIVNSPVMPAVQVSQIKEEKAGNKVESNGMGKTFNGQGSEMMTFAKNLDFGHLVKAQDEAKTSFNFFKPGLKKSGSMKMMQKMQQQNLPIQANRPGVQGISPWQLPQNTEQSQQLQQCQTCNRKFNPKSYSKHIKVCQKVFFQKRKPFNWRSGSLDKKANTNSK